MSSRDYKAPTALAIGGLDPSGGAGLVADVKTFAAHHVHGAAVLTALTAQSTCEVRDVVITAPQDVASQIDVVCADLRPTAWKTGMLADAAVVAAVATQAHTWRPASLVVDPVVASTTGARLLSDDGVDVLCAQILPLATLVTPNVPELGRLSGGAVETFAARLQAAERVLRFGVGAVLVKGGHDSGDDVVDVLVLASRERFLFAHARWPGPGAHGGGCVLASAIAAHLARGSGLVAAVRASIAFAADAVQNAQHVGAGRPVAWPLAAGGAR